MALEDRSPFYVNQLKPTMFIINGDSLANRPSMLSANARNTNPPPLVTVAPVRRVRKVAGPSVAPTSYFSKESSGNSYFVDDYFGIS
jgi:hypothetical protein